LQIYHFAASSAAESCQIRVGLAHVTVAAMKKIDAGCGGQWMEVSQAESWKGRLFILCQAQDFRLSPGESVNGFPDAHH